MDIKVRESVSDLHSEVIDHRYLKTQWWPMLESRLSGPEFQELVSSAKMGLDYLLGNENVEALAITQFQWMSNPMEITREVFGQSGVKKADRKMETVTLPSWLERMKRDKSPSRPKDLLHLSVICEIAENIDSFDDMF